MRNLYTTAVCILLLVSKSAFSQICFDDYLIGINYGTFVYTGKLANTSVGNFQNNKRALGFYISKPINQIFSVELRYTTGTISANENFSSNKVQQKRGLAFFTFIDEFSFVGKWNWKGNHTSFIRPKFSPYVGIGISGTVMDTKRYTSNFDTSYFGSRTSTFRGLQIDSRKKPDRFTVNIPVFIGFNARIDKRFSFNGEFNYRLNFNNYLDGFNQVHAGGLDGFYSLSVGLSYKIGLEGIRCPWGK
jgi:Domain of unknown function (DUF6089)